jgi:hypothetical protein
VPLLKNASFTEQNTSKARIEKSIMENSEELKDADFSASNKSLFDKMRDFTGGGNYYS